MTDYRAADLPEASIVADDLRGIAFYANAGPGEPERWDTTGEKDSTGDAAVDWAMRHGAEVVRVGDGMEG
jgi:hypothetical protein